MQIRKVVYLVLFVFLFGMPAILSAGIIDKITVDQANHSAEISVQNVNHKDYDAFLLQYPQRLVLDVKTNGRACKEEKRKSNSVIKSIRYAMHGKECRIVFDLDQSKTFEYDERYIPTDSSLLLRIIPVSTKVIMKSTARGREAVVFIDAGHGGKDPGAIGIGGTKEKSITLLTAKYLAYLIDQEYGMRAVISRKDDRYIRLRDRIQYAKNVKADLFISIHADSAPTSSAQGASVYILSNKGASSEAARLLARRENEVDWLGDNELKQADKNVASILIDLSQTASLNHSRALASEILRSLRAQAKKKQVESAGFVVLKSANIPSILIELGYLSNRAEEIKLKTSLHRKKMSRLILKGIKKYFYRYATSDLLLAQTSVKNYRVQKGDTLSHIALRFGVDTQKIKTMSKLRSNTIRVGQILRIPAR